MIYHLVLTNFRNHKSYKIDFADITIFIGPNGIGKTNIIEAVWMLADGRSWRTKSDLEVISWDEDFAKVSADGKMELILQNKQEEKVPPKLLKINGIKHRLIDLFGQMPAILFSPEEIQMVNGAPNLRRRFLDICLAQVDRKFALALLDYTRVLKGRNKLLSLIKHGRGKPDELDFWDEKLAIIGVFIIKKRKNLIKFFNQKLSTTYQEISGKKEELKLIYKGTVEENKFLDYLVANRENEINQELTTHGPHRDDFLIDLNGKSLAETGSRGEFRSAVLALKILELKYLQEQIDEKPILLLDDIFSELDSERRVHLAKIVENQQTIITTTDLDHIDKKLRDKAKIVELG